MTKTVAIIQARQGSSRLPGKTLSPLVNDTSVLAYMIRRLRPSKTLDQIIVATTDRPEDAAIAAECQAIGFPCFRGDADDVLARYTLAARQESADHIVRLTGDCPLQDYAVVDHLVHTFQHQAVDYAANAITPSYPDGFDAEIMSRDALETAYEQAQLPSQREHVTPYIHAHPEQFNILNVPYHRNAADLRLTLDTADDYTVLQNVAKWIDEHEHYVHIDAIVDYVMAHPELRDINGDEIRNAGYLKSLKNDQNSQK